MVGEGELLTEYVCPIYRKKNASKDVFLSVYNYQESKEKNHRVPKHSRLLQRERDRESKMGN